MKGTNTAVVLKKLQPGTEYDISVSARYRSGLGEALEGRGSTLGGKFMCEWTAPADPSGVILLTLFGLSASTANIDVPRLACSCLSRAWRPTRQPAGVEYK